MTLHQRTTWCLWACVLLSATSAAAGDDNWPTLPDVDAAVEVPAQEWPLRPGPRKVRVLVHYPGGKLANVGPATGVMLTLHNWGGVDCVGTADPRQLANRFNVVALCVNYLQSGPKDSIEGPEPYDFGYLQALDALRTLYFALHRLRELDRPFGEGRIYCTGGSGGGNVTLMANKLAPHTFAAVIDLCGMKKLTDDIAFNLPGGSSLNARYVRDANNPYRLTRDEQEIRFVGHPDHVRHMQRLRATAKVIVVHGVEDTTCPFADAVELVDALRREGLDVESKYVRADDLDGKVFTSAGHALGNRTEIVAQMAGKYLSAESAERRVLAGPDDFQRRSVIRYRTSSGEFVISYKQGFPVGRFEPQAPPPPYPTHQQLDFYLDAKGERQPIRTPADWTRRKNHIRRQLELVMGEFPSALDRVPLDVKVIAEERVGKLIRRKITYQSDRDDRVPAYLIYPAEALESATAPSAKPSSAAEARPNKRLPAMLCLHQTTAEGKNEVAGIAGSPDLKYALELAERGFVTLSPDYPSLGEHSYDFAPAHGYASGSMKAIWDSSRAVDLLETLDFVDPRRIGCIGHSLGGHNSIFTAVFDERLQAIVSSCGFSSMTKDDVPSWNGARYMPRIATQFGNDAARLPFDFHELIAALAPRHVFISAATRDDDFDVSGVRDVVAAARPIYELHDAEGRLVAHYPDAPHSFPAEARQRAYDFLEQALDQRAR